MALSKSFFGVRSGSTKSLTFSTYRGMQVTKERVARISNPQSSAQMQQRLLIPMVAQCRSMLSDLIDHSFEGVDYGWKSRQHFSALNLRKGALNVRSYVPKGAKEPGVADFIISTGSLPSIDVSEEGGSVGDYHGLFCGLNVPVLTAHAAMKIGDPIPSDWYDAFLKENPILQKGDQVTFLECVVNGDYQIGTIAGLYKQFVISRIVLDSASADNNFKFLENMGNLAIFTNGVMKVALFAISAEATIKKVFATSLDYADADRDGGMQIGEACILSRKVNNTWKRSTARLYIDVWTGTIVSYEKAFSTYVKSGSSSAKYLNTGSETAGIKGS